MDDYRDAISRQIVSLPRWGFRRMAQLVKVLFSLSRLPVYRAAVFPKLPEIACIDPGHDALMMGYDFHWTEQGPKLIEVNTNAGGWLLALLACFGEQVWQPKNLPPRVRSRLLDPFTRELLSWSNGTQRQATGIAIVDKQPETQFLFGEMDFCRRLLATEWDIPVALVDPEMLDAGPQGVFSEGRSVELIYNRHCDFYLEDKALAGIRAAYATHQICLSPNPFAYGLLADKRRLVLWSDSNALANIGVTEKIRNLLADMIPTSKILADFDRNNLWKKRLDWVFKPATRYGSRGVLLGRKITRSRFDNLDPTDTLVQQFIPPSTTQMSDGSELKTDFRLYVYRDRILGVTARLYQGQVTNLRTPGGGFAAVVLV